MASVWYQQVEEALISLIQSTIILDGSPVKAIVRYPETEFTSADYPCVAISNIGTTFDKQRWDDYWAKGNIDTVNNTVELLPPAFPYNLDYQIDLWSKSLGQINDMSRMWLGNVPPRTVLTAKETTGVSRDCNMFLDALTSSDVIKDNTRIFRRIYTYTIWVELDERPIVTKNVVKKVTIKNTAPTIL